MLSGALDVLDVVFIVNHAFSKTAGIPATFRLSPSPAHPPVMVLLVDAKSTLNSGVVLSTAGSAKVATVILAPCAKPAKSEHVIIAQIANRLFIVVSFHYMYF
jgi:hypothetical protein